MLVAFSFIPINKGYLKARWRRKCSGGNESFLMVKPDSELTVSLLLDLLGNKIKETAKMVVKEV